MSKWNMKLYFFKYVVNTLKKENILLSILCRYGCLNENRSGDRLRTIIIGDSRDVFQ